MRYIHFILLGLLIAVQCTTIGDKYPALKQRKSLIQIMNAVEMKVSSKSPIKEVNKLVDDYAEQIKEEQLSQQSLYEKQTKECDDEIAFRDTEIDAANDSITKSQFALESCNTQQQRAQNDLQTLNQQIIQTQNYLAQLISSREQKAEDFKKNSIAYKNNSEAADDAIEILLKIWSGEASLIDLAEYTNKLLIQASKIKKVKKLSPVMASLTQLTTNKIAAEDVLINNVLKLLRDFRDAIEKDYEQTKEDELDAIGIFNNSRARTEDFLASLESAKSDIEIELSKLNRCIDNQTAILSTAQAKLNRNTLLLQSAENMCVSFNKEYEAATQARNQELELVKAIKEKIEQRYSKLSKSQKRDFEDNNNDHFNIQFEYEGDDDEEIQQNDNLEDVFSDEVSRQSRR